MESIVQISAALLTPTIAVFGAYIAHRQWCLAQNRLKFDLFEKRLSIYQAVRTLLSSIMTSGKAADDEMFKFMVGTREAKWLLSGDIARYLDEDIWEKAVDLQTLDAELQGKPRGDERTSNVHKQRDIKQWLHAQFDVLDEKFSPFLQLTH